MRSMAGSALSKERADLIGDLVVLWPRDRIRHCENVRRKICLGLQVKFEKSSRGWRAERSSRFSFVVSASRADRPLRARS